MIIFKKTADLTLYIRKLKERNIKLGFVPTMGALHQGHLSLLDQCIKENDITVCSIFINPTQFNNKEDFNKYPVTIEKDIEQLENSGCHVLFLPSVEEVYPVGYVKKHFDLGSLETVLEGKYRPGHFQGVCEVVDRFLSIIKPDRLYLGQKDFQQCMVIKRLIQLSGYDTELRIIETMRERSGLAMSSRNMRLSAEQKEKATAIFNALVYIYDNNNYKSRSDLINAAKGILEKSEFKVDYVEIADKETLLPADGEEKKPKVALIAATIGNIRLIDNMQLN